MYYIDIVTLLHWHYYYIYFYIYWHCYIHTLLHKFVALFITYIGKSAGTWCLPLNPHQRLVFAGWETKYAISTFIGLLIICICIILVFVFVSYLHLYHISILREYYFNFTFFCLFQCLFVFVCSDVYFFPCLFVFCHMWLSLGLLVHQSDCLLNE